MLIEAERLVEAQCDAAALSRFGEIHDGRVLRVEAARGMAWIDLGAAGVGMLDLGKQKLVEGAAIRVQIARDAQGGKHHGLRQRLEIPSSSLILLPSGEGIEIPRSLPPAERKRLRAAAEDFALPGEGWSLRSSAAELPPGALATEAARLRAQAPPDRISSPQRVWAPGSPVVESVRRWLAKAPSAEITCDDGTLLRELHAADLRMARRCPPGALLLADFADDLSAALTVSTPLPHGGRLHIEVTQALTAIDVDLGGAAAPSDGNLAAAEAVGRQIRLRSVAGLIVVDFTRMASDRDRQRVRERLERALSPCHPPCNILGFTRAGLLEITRTREVAPWTLIGDRLDAFLKAAETAP